MFRAFPLFKRPSLKLSGDAYVAGDTLLLLIGGVGSSWNQILGAALFLMAALIMSRRGDDGYWFEIASGLAMPAILFTNLDELLAGLIPTIIGTCLYLTSETMGVLNKPLTRLFTNHDHFFLRTTLGTSRAWMGIFSFSSKLCMIIDAVLYRHWGMLTVLLLWSLGDLLTGVSQVRLNHAK